MHLEGEIFWLRFFFFFSLLIRAVFQELWNSLCSDLWLSLKELQMFDCTCLYLSSQHRNREPIQENLHSHNKTDLREVKKEMKREKQRKRYIKDFSGFTWRNRSPVVLNPHDTLSIVGHKRRCFAECSCCSFQCRQWACFSRK